MRIIIFLLLLPFFASAQNNAAKIIKSNAYGIGGVRSTFGNSVGFQIDSTGSIIRYNNSTITNYSILLGNGSKFALSTGTAGQHLTGNGWKDTAATVTITESTYTPTLTNTTNIAASTAYTTYYSRIGDWVSVWGEVDIDATTLLTISEMAISLPISCDITNTYQLAGNGSFEDNTVVQIKGDVTNNRAMLRFTPQSGSNNKYSFHFTYKHITP